MSLIVEHEFSVVYEKFLARFGRHATLLKSLLCTKCDSNHVRNNFELPSHDIAPTYDADVVAESALVAAPHRLARSPIPKQHPTDESTDPTCVTLLTVFALSYSDRLFCLPLRYGTAARRRWPRNSVPTGSRWLRFPAHGR